MKYSLWLVVFAAISGCGEEPVDNPEGGDVDHTAPTGSTSDPETTCGNLLETFPADGSTDLALTTAIEFTFDETDGEEVITVTRDGAGVNGRTTIEGNRVFFEVGPSEGLRPLSDYEVQLDWCGGPTISSWGTGLVDATYSFDLGSGRFVSPAGIGPLIQQQLEQALLLGVVATSPTELESLGGLSTLDYGTQDDCSPTFDFPVADFTANPDFAAGPTTLDLFVEGVAIHFEDAYLSGTFTSSTIDNAVLSGSIDTRPLAALVGATGEPAAICELVATFGVQCVTCSDGSPFCLDVLVDNISVDWAPGLVLEPITQQQANANCP